ncbi:MAG: EAL domain-containing protein [Actinomycetota bacterium]
MGSDPKRFYPAVELLAGVLAALAWVFALDTNRQLSSDELVMTISTGLVGATAAAAATLAMRLAGRGHEAKLDQLTDDAKRDALTGLFNRAELFRVLDESIVAARREGMVLGVLFLDLDRFKQVNDTMGHEAGDELLKIVAQRLQSTIRSTDVVARLGGDEFVVLCRDLIAADSVVGMARQILRRFDDPVSVRGLDHRIGTSIGVAIASPEDARSADDLVRDADAAMYRAKHSKAGIVVFDDAHRLQMADRQDIERDLRTAVERGELVVHYQPIVDVGGRRLHGFEALVRWNHPDRGELNPAEFLHIAGEAGQIGWIGDFVLRQACSQAAAWNEVSTAARQLKMSVNLAEAQLLDPKLGLRVTEILSWAGLPPDQLVLELSEKTAIEHAEGLEELRHLRGLGVEVAIDDFGQSAMGLVKDFDVVSTLKIRKHLVRDMRAGDADRALVEAAVTVARSLGMGVVAEGVEFEDQMVTLQELGIDLMQGYLFSAPLAADGIEPARWFPSPADASG